MLGMRTYPRPYIDDCRARMEAQLAVYRQAAADCPALVTAPVSTVFFNNMVLVLDSYFMHRLRGVEGKDGNALNEVRVLCSSMLTSHEVMGEDSAIRMNSETSVLGLKVGDPIALAEADFVRLADAYFAEMDSKFAA